MSLFGGVEIPGHPDLENVRRLDLLAIPFIRRAHRLGIAIDKPRFAEIGAQFSAEAIEVEKDISSYIPSDKLADFNARSEAIEEEYGDASINASSAEQIGKLLFDVLGLGTDKNLKKTSTGRVSTGKKQLELIRLDHPVVPKILRHRELSKLVSNYCNKLPLMAKFHPRSVGSSACPVCELSHDTDQWRIHGEMGTTRAETGRINHKNPNLGNIATRTKDGQEVQACFIAPPGKVLVHRDASQIELRGLAHLSDCKSMIAVYAEDGDLHTDTCWRTGLTPRGEKPGVAQRMGAKRCVAKGQRVLTDRGLVAIEKLLCNDLVWDGIEWVSHDGVVCNGIREVMTYEGLTATPDHIVWGEDGTKTSLREMHRRGVRLAVTGNQETPVRYGHDHEHQDTAELDWIPVRLHALLPLRERRRDAGQQYRGREVQELQMHQRVEVRRRSTSKDLMRSIQCNQTTLQQSKLRRLSQLWRTWDRESLQRLNRVRRLRFEKFATRHLQESRYRTYRQRWALRTWKYSIRNSRSESSESSWESLGSLQTRADCSRRYVRASQARLSKLQTQSSPYRAASFSRNSMVRNSTTHSERCIQEEVYDIVNAGPRHRFTVEDKLVSNCNFGIQNGTTEKGLFLQLVMDFGSKGTAIPDWLTEPWCAKFIEDWLDSRPEVRDFFELQWYRARRYGLVWTSMGRVRLVPEVRSYHPWIKQAGLRQAQNLPVTGLAADQLKLAMGKSNQALLEMYDNGKGVWCWPLLTIHDAIKVEADEDAAEAVADILAWSIDTCMTDEETGEHRFRVPIKSDGSIDQRWVVH